VATFFEASIECIVKAVLDQCRMAHKPISVRRFFFSSIVSFCIELAFKHVVLVGGFAASDWLFNKVQEKLLPHDLNITRPEQHVSVAASLEINVVLTSYSGIRPCPMAPCHSITTALYALESPSLPTELS